MSLFLSYLKFCIILYHRCDNIVFHHYFPFFVYLASRNIANQGRILPRHCWVTSRHVPIRSSTHRGRSGCFVCLGGGCGAGRGSGSGIQAEHPTELTVGPWEARTSPCGLILTIQTSGESQGASSQGLPWGDTLLSCTSVRSAAGNAKHKHKLNPVREGPYRWKTDRGWVLGLEMEPLQPLEPAELRVSQIPSSITGKSPASFRGLENWHVSR